MLKNIGNRADQLEERISKFKYRNDSGRVRVRTELKEIKELYKNSLTTLERAI